MKLTSTLTFALTSPVISRVDVRDSTWGGLERRCALKMVKEHTGSLLERTSSFVVGIDDGLHRVIPGVLNSREENIHTFLLIVGVVLPKYHVVVNLGPTCGKGIGKDLQSFVPSLVDYRVDHFLNTGTLSSKVYRSHHVMTEEEIGKASILVRISAPDMHPQWGISK